MAISRRSGRSRFTLLLLVLTSITVITLDFRDDGDGMIAALRNGASDAIAPVRDAADTVLSPVGDALSGITGYGDLEDQNAELRARIAELEGQELYARNATRELQELLGLQRLDYVGDLPTVAARVVSAPVSNFEQTIELDRGTDHGVDVDMPVLTGAGLIGRVVQASGSRSVVQLITDPGASVGVRLSRSGELGVAEGEGPGRPLSVGFIEIGTRVRPRELVVTSGVDDSLFPGGLPVGRVVSSTAGAGELEQEVDIEPVADLETLRFVKVLQWRPATPS